jgi:hypothetical protein
MGNFSERIGIIEPRKSLQIKSIDNNLRNSLWNILYELYHEEEGYVSVDYWTIVAKHVAKFFKKSLIDELPLENYDCFIWLKNYFYQLNWYEVYNFIEFITNKHEIMMNEPYGGIEKSQLLDTFNSILERELSGYRFISGLLTPISDKVEVEAIESAIKNADDLGLVGVKEHIHTAIDLLGKKPKPDYRNAIKEAISSVESIAKIISGSNSQGLSGALNQLSQKISIHSALKKGFIKLYGYSSDENGIRHAILKQSNIDFAEAKYMIVSCSAFVNYLIEKANQTGLLTNK